MNDTILNNYQRWTERAIADVDVINELKDIAENEEKIEDAFYKDLAFGTGGLRGVIGAGTNRLNVYTVAKASQGLADYVIKNFAPEKRKIAVSFDSRIKSDVFAKVASGVFAANGIKVEIYSELMPTPCLSFAVRYLGCAAGVMVTASHNPAKYNGYKVYGADGCQITTEAAAEILAEIEKLDIFDDVKRISFEEGFEAGICIRRHTGQQRCCDCLFSFKWYRLKARHSYIKRIWLYKYNCRKRTRTARWYFPNLSIS